MSDPDTRTAEQLIAQGWTVSMVSLYDEEGVEGWTWTSPDGEEFTVIGGWDDPPPLPELPKGPTPEDIARREEKRKLAEFLDRLMRPPNE